MGGANHWYINCSRYWAWWSIQRNHIWAQCNQWNFWVSWWIHLQKEIFLVAVHLPGNVVADQESRVVKDRCKWMRKPEVFKHIPGSLWGGFVCISPYQATTTVLQLEARSRSRGNGCIQSRLVPDKGFVLVPDPWLIKVKRQKAKLVLITPVWNTQP